MSTYSLTIVSGAPLKKYTVSTNSIIIGTGIGSQINLPDISLPQARCRITRAADGRLILVYIKKHGRILVNTVPVLNQPLISGDGIQIGNVCLRFETVGLAETVFAPPTEPQPQAPISRTPPPPPEALSRRAARPLSRFGKPAARTSRSAVPIGGPRRATPPATAERPKTHAFAPAPAPKSKTWLVLLVVGGIIVVGIILYAIANTPSQADNDLGAIYSSAIALVKDGKTVEADEMMGKAVTNTRFAECSSLKMLKQLYNANHGNAENERNAAAEISQFNERVQAAIKKEEIQQKISDFCKECVSLSVKYSGTGQDEKLRVLTALLVKYKNAPKPADNDFAPQ